MEQSVALEKAYIAISGIIQSDFEITDDMRRQLRDIYEEIAMTLYPESFEVLECGCIFPLAPKDPLKPCKKHKRNPRWRN